MSTSTSLIKGIYKRHKTQTWHFTLSAPSHIKRKELSTITVKHSAMREPSSKSFTQPILAASQVQMAARLCWMQLAVSKLIWKARLSNRRILALQSRFVQVGLQTTQGTQSMASSRLMVTSTSSATHAPMMAASCSSSLIESTTGSKASTGLTLKASQVNAQA